MSKTIAVDKLDVVSLELSDSSGNPRASIDFEVAPVKRRGLVPFKYGVELVYAVVPGTKPIWTADLTSPQKEELESAVRTILKLVNRAV